VGDGKNSIEEMLGVVTGAGEGDAEGIEATEEGL
jgi:hypothetical protein